MKTLSFMAFALVFSATIAQAQLLFNYTDGGGTVESGTFVDTAGKATDPPIGNFDSSAEKVKFVNGAGGPYTVRIYCYCLEPEFSATLLATQVVEPYQVIQMPNSFQCDAGCFISMTVQGGSITTETTVLL